jgi:hypothetical protein
MEIRSDNPAEEGTDVDAYDLGLRATTMLRHQEIRESRLDLTELLRERREAQETVEQDGRCFLCCFVDERRFPPSNPFASFFCSRSCDTTRWKEKVKEIGLQRRG